NDPLSGLNISDVSVTEGNSGTTNAVLTVSLSAASALPVSVNWTTANGTASAPSDYLANSGTLTFAAGQTIRTITIVVNGDTLNEADETFLVNLSNAVNATINDAQGVVTIANDDALPQLTINNVTLAEGNTGTTNAVLTVNLSAASALPVSVNWATANGTASAPSDYLANSGTLTIATGQTTGTITVVVNGDTLNEADETFFVNLSNAANASIGDAQGVVTIANDDALPQLTINNVTLAEGNTGTTNAVLTVSLSAASALPVSMNWATANGTASAPSDYLANSGTLTIATGQTTGTITVVVNGDTLNEPDETFFVNLSNGANATISDAQGVVTIANDDALPQLAINNVTLAEGNTGTINAVLTVNLSAASALPVSVNW